MSGIRDKVKTQLIDLLVKHKEELVLFSHDPMENTNWFADQILNLKGADWKIAIVSDWSYTNPDGNKYAQVIWQAGE